MAILQVGLKSSVWPRLKRWYRSFCRTRLQLATRGQNVAKISATLCVEGRAGGLKSTVLRDGRPSSNTVLFSAAARPSTWYPIQNITLKVAPSTTARDWTAVSQETHSAIGTTDTIPICHIISRGIAALRTTLFGVYYCLYQQKSVWHYHTDTLSCSATYKGDHTCNYHQSIFYSWYNPIPTGSHRCGYHNLGRHWPSKLCVLLLSSPREVSRGARKSNGSHSAAVPLCWLNSGSVFLPPLNLRSAPPLPSPNLKSVSGAIDHGFAPREGLVRCCTHNLHGQWRPRLW